MSQKLLCAFGLLLLASIGTLDAADLGKGKSNWDRLLQLRTGESIQVTRRGAEPLTGSFGAVTPERLQVVRNQKEQVDVNRADVLRVDRLLKRSSARAAAPAIGAAIGFGTGFAVGYAEGSSNSKPCFGPCPSKPAVGGVIGLIGAGIGGTVGYFAKGKTKEVVYRSE